MTPAAKFENVPWKARATARPAAPSTATKDVVLTPSVLMAATPTIVTRPMWTRLATKGTRIGSTRLRPRAFNVSLLAQLARTQPRTRTTSAPATLRGPPGHPGDDEGRERIEVLHEIPRWKLVGSRKRRTVASRSTPGVRLRPSEGPSVRRGHPGGKVAGRATMRHPSQRRLVLADRTRRYAQRARATTRAGPRPRVNNRDVHRFSAAPGPRPRHVAGAAA